MNKPFKDNTTFRGNMIKSHGNIIIELPDNFDRWFGTKVVVLPGLEDSFRVVSVEKYQEIENKFRETLEIPLIEAKTVDPVSIMLQGYETVITNDGHLKMHPKASGDFRDLMFINGGWDITIMRNFKECKCDDRACGKCILVNCKDPFCSMHSIHKKISQRDKLLKGNLADDVKADLESQIQKLSNYLKIIEGVELNLADYEENADFEILGERFKIRYFPNMYDMYRTSKYNLENQLQSIADAWHEGSVISAAIAFESDMKYL